MFKEDYHDFDTVTVPAGPETIPRRAGRRPNVWIVEKRTNADIMPKRTGFVLSRRRAETEFECLVRPHLDYLYRLAYRFTGAADRAEDLIQDLLVRLYPRRAELARIEQPRPWLVRVMYRMFIDDVRRNARAPIVPIAGSDLAGTEEEGDPYAKIVDPAPGPEAEMELNLSREELQRAWERLNPEHKALLTLHDVEGYTLNELEISLETPLGTLKSRLHRARARLAELLKMERFGASIRVINSKRGI
jgi:RNA polymerase sigma-70 factor (ECF subfamily)